MNGTASSLPAGPEVWISPPSLPVDFFLFLPSGASEKRGKTTRGEPGSHGGLVGFLLQQLGREQGVRGWGGVPGVGNHQPDLLVGPSPLGIELAVVAERHLG